MTHVLPEHHEKIDPALCLEIRGELQRLGLEATRVLVVTGRRSGPILMLAIRFRSEDDLKRFFELTDAIRNDDRVRFYVSGFEGVDVPSHDLHNLLVFLKQK